MSNAIKNVEQFAGQAIKTDRKTTFFRENMLLVAMFRAGHMLVTCRTLLSYFASGANCITFVRNR